MCPLCCCIFHNFQCSNYLYYTKIIVYLLCPPLPEMGIFINIQANEGLSGNSYFMCSPLLQILWRGCSSFTGESCPTAPNANFRYFLLCFHKGGFPLLNFDEPEFTTYSRAKVFTAFERKNKVGAAELFGKKSPRLRVVFVCPKPCFS